jgi:hypothetical protein
VFAGMCRHEDHALMGAEASMTPVVVPDLLKVMEAAGVLRVGRTTWSASTPMARNAVPAGRWPAACASRVVRGVARVSDHGVAAT